MKLEGLQHLISRFTQIKALWYWCIDRQIEQSNRIDLTTQRQVIFDTGNSVEKGQSFSPMVMEQLSIHTQINERQSITTLKNLTQNGS